MITGLSQKTVDALCASQIISESDRELYNYGFFVIYTRLLFLLMTIIFGCLFNIVWESILMYFVFTLVRSYAGGVHASKESICLALTTLSIFVCVVAIRLLVIFDDTVTPLICLFLECFFIIILCPIDSIEKPLSKAEKKRYKVIVIIIVSVILCAIPILTLLGIKRVLYACTVSLALEGILLLLGHRQISPNSHR